MRNPMPIYIIAGTILFLIAVVIIISNLPNNNNNKNKTNSNMTTTTATTNSNETLEGGLIVKTILKGTGEVSTVGKKITVNYTGKIPGVDKPFDSSIGKAPFSFTLGTNQVIQGWEMGLVNRTVGSKLELTIPSPLGYGERGFPPVIPQNATLVFDVEILSLS